MVKSFGMNVPTESHKAADSRRAKECLIFVKTVVRFKTNKQRFYQSRMHGKSRKAVMASQGLDTGYRRISSMQNPVAIAECYQ